MSNSNVTSDVRVDIRSPEDVLDAAGRLQDDELDGISGGDGTVCLVSVTPPATIIRQRG